MSSLTNPSWPERYHVFATGISLTETAGAGNILALNNRNEVVRVPGTAEVDLTDYYTKEEIDESTYEKEEVDQMLWVKADKVALEDGLASKVDKTYVDVQLSLKADSMNVHTKNETVVLLATKADRSTTYTKAQVDSALAPKASQASVTAALALKADTATTYTSAAVDNLLSGKANSSDTYTRAQIDNKDSLKADKSDTYTKAQVDSKVSTCAVGGFIPNENPGREIQNMILCNDYTKETSRSLRTGTRLTQVPSGNARIQSNTVIGEKNLNGGMVGSDARSELRFNVAVGNRILKTNELEAQRNVLLGTDICNYIAGSNGTFGSNPGKQNDNVVVGSEIMKTWGGLTENDPYDPMAMINHAGPYSFSENIVIGSKIDQTSPNVGTIRGIDNCIIVGRNLDLPANDVEKLKDAIIIGSTQKHCQIKGIWEQPLAWDAEESRPRLVWVDQRGKLMADYGTIDALVQRIEALEARLK